MNEQKYRALDPKSKNITELLRQENIYCKIFNSKLKKLKKVKIREP